MLPPLKFSITTTGRLEVNWRALEAIFRYSCVMGGPPKPSGVKHRAVINVVSLMLMAVAYFSEVELGSFPLVVYRIVSPATLGFRVMESEEVKLPPSVEKTGVPGIGGEGLELRRPGVGMVRNSWLPGSAFSAAPPMSVGIRKNSLRSLRWSKACTASTLPLPFFSR